MSLRDLNCLCTVQRVYLSLLLSLLELVPSIVEQCPGTEKYYGRERNEITSKKRKYFLWHETSTANISSSSAWEERNTLHRSFGHNSYVAFTLCIDTMMADYLWPKQTAQNIDKLIQFCSRNTSSSKYYLDSCQQGKKHAFRVIFCADKNYLRKSFIY